MRMVSADVFGNIVGVMKGEGGVTMEMGDTPYIGNRGDTLVLLNESLEETRLDQTVKEVLELLKDALEREIV
jgi:hypothetical protein